MKAWLLRILYYGLPTVVLIIIVLAMNAGPILKRPFGSHDDVSAELDRVSELALSDRWAPAREATEDLKEAWEAVRGRLRFSSTTDEIETFDLMLAELEAAVAGRDRVLLRSAHLRLTALWEDLGS